MPRRVVVLGGGFAGLTFCQELGPIPGVEIVLIDRQNHHLFQPLLYQVATAGLSAPQIAQPLRQIFSKRWDIRVLLEEAVAIDPEARTVTLASSTGLGQITEDGTELLGYDALILATGARTAYFGNDAWAEHAPGMKTLDDALAIRNRLLRALEEAESGAEGARLERLLTAVVIGAGPTGVELAGAIAELAEFARRDFRNVDLSRFRVILVEMAGRVLNHMPEELSAKAEAQLRNRGVDVRTGTRVVEIDEGRVVVEPVDGRGGEGEAGGSPERRGRETLRAETILWAAGVEASPLTRCLGVALDRGGRVEVEPDLSVPGHPEIFALGDLAHLVDTEGQEVPGVSPAAMQMARHAAEIVEAELRAGKLRPGQAPGARKPFRYWDKGTMATIGRKAAVAEMGKLRLSGYLAWLAWLFVHLIFLIGGLRNKLTVLIQWVYSYLFYKPGALILSGLDKTFRLLGR